MNHQLEDMIAEAERQRDEVSALLAEIDDERFSRRPEPHRWSPGEQIAHVPLTDRPYLERIARALSDARQAGRTSNGPFKGQMIGSWFARLMEPPPKRRMRTPNKLEPAADLERAEVRADFVACREELIEQLRAADGVDIDRARMRSPFLAVLKMPVFCAFEVLLAHGRRHIWLAKQTLAEVARRP